MMRTIPRAVFNDSIITVALATGSISTRWSKRSRRCGYQRVPQTEEPGDFSVRGGIVDVFSPLYRYPVRIELEDDIVTSIRHFDAVEPALGAANCVEATIIRTRYVPPSALKDAKLRDQVGAARRGNRHGAQGGRANCPRRSRTACCFPARNC